MICSIRVLYKQRGGVIVLQLLRAAKSNSLPVSGGRLIMAVGDWAGRFGLESALDALKASAHRRSM
jgi:hypothetical protein